MKRRHGILETVNQHTRKQSVRQNYTSVYSFDCNDVVLLHHCYRVEQPLSVIEQTASYCVFYQKLLLCANKRSLISKTDGGF